MKNPNKSRRWTTLVASAIIAPILGVAGLSLVSPIANANGGGVDQNTVYCNSQSGRLEQGSPSAAANPNLTKVGMIAEIGGKWDFKAATDKWGEDCKKVKPTPTATATETTTQPTATATETKPTPTATATETKPTPTATATETTTQPTATATETVTVTHTPLKVTLVGDEKCFATTDGVPTVTGSITNGNQAQNVHVVVTIESTDVNVGNQTIIDDVVKMDAGQVLPFTVEPGVQGAVYTVTATGVDKVAVSVSYTAPVVCSTPPPTETPSATATPTATETPTTPKPSESTSTSVAPTTKTSTSSSTSVAVAVATCSAGQIMSNGQCVVPGVPNTGQGGIPGWVYAAFAALAAGIVYYLRKRVLAAR